MPAPTIGPGTPQPGGPPVACAVSRPEPDPESVTPAANKNRGLDGLHPRAPIVSRTGDATAAAEVAEKRTEAHLLKQIWLSVRSNPLFVSAWTAFAGALASQLYIAEQGGRFDFSLGSWEKMLTAAAGAALLSVLHLYTPAPGANPNK